MVWLVVLLVHGVACSLAVAALCARAMSSTSRVWWLAAVVLVPVVGVVAYAVWVLRRDRGGGGLG